MGFQYKLTVSRLHNDVQPHVMIEMISGKGPTAYRKLASDLGAFNSEAPEDIKKLENISSIIEDLNKELTTFKTRYEGKREVTGMKVYTSIIVAAIMHRFLDDFPALDIKLSDEAKYLYGMYVIEEALGINAGLQETEDQIFTRYHFPFINRKSCIDELTENRKAIFMAMDHYSRIYTHRNIFETIYGRKLDLQTTREASRMLYDKAMINGYDWTTGSFLSSPDPDYIVEDDISSLINASVKLVYCVITQKTGLSVLKVMETLKNEGRRTVYDQSVSISLEKPSRALSTILKAYNTIPDRYERLEDSLKTMDILLANI